MGRQTDILLIDTPQYSSPLTQIILELIGEAIIILPVDLRGRIGGYQLIKSIHLFKEDLKIGVVVTKACTAQEAKATFEGTRTIVKRHLGIELRDYGFLLNDLNITRSIEEGKTPLSSIANSRLKRFILSIADLVSEVKGEGSNDFCERFKLALKGGGLG